MKLSYLLITVSFSTALLFAAPISEESTEAIKLGKESAAKLAQTLGKNMKAHMKSGGPLDALNFCSSEAYDLTESVNQTLHISAKAKRVSLNNRSTANTPDANEQKVLTALQELKNSGTILPEYLLQKTGKKSYKFYKPILIDNAVCLKCHGTLEDGKLKNSITQRYPDDKATGYKMDDLRGAIVVDITTK